MSENLGTLRYVLKDFCCARYTVKRLGIYKNDNLSLTWGWGLIRGYRIWKSDIKCQKKKQFLVDIAVILLQEKRRNVI